MLFRSAPFGLWTFILTAMSYLLATNLRAALDADLSPVTMSIVTVSGSTVALASFVVCGAILGQDVGSPAFIFQELLGNALWALLLSPIFVPITISAYRATLTARNR